MFFCTVLPASAAGAKTAATVSASARRSANQEPLLKITSPSRAALSRAASNIRRPQNPGPGHCSLDTAKGNSSVDAALPASRVQRPRLRSVPAALFVVEHHAELFDRTRRCARVRNDVRSSWMYSASLPKLSPMKKGSFAVFLDGPGEIRTRDLG